MKKNFFSTLPRPLRRLAVTISSLGIISLFLMSGGCGKKIYTPPDKEVKSHIILVNEIYAPGFYVEVDGGDAGFLQKELDVLIYLIFGFFVILNTHHQNYKIVNKYLFIAIYTLLIH